MFIKQDNCTSIKQVIERNTGMNIDVFLSPPENPSLHNLDKAVKCLREHIHESIHIIGDYDVDGICATAILYLGLKRVGIHAKTRLPRRQSEGYGLSEKIIDEINSGIVITVDNGIAAKSAIRKAKEKGLTVIVIDHHLAPRDEKTGERILPDADVLLDPNAEDISEYKQYCGAGLAYRFIKTFTPDIYLIDLLILASIATVGDMVELTGANRELVWQGLLAINQNVNLSGLPGLKLLLEQIQLTNGITEDDYGYKICPIFNASGRIFDNGSEKVLEVLKATKETPFLVSLVEEICTNNEKRKELVKKAMPVAKRLAHNKRPIVIYHPSFHEGIIGIIAGNLAEEYQCPVIVFTQTHNGNLKGSGRSVPGIHLKNTLDKIQKHIIGYGGHEGAAGLTIKGGTLEVFREVFSEACGTIQEKTDDVYYDIVLTQSKLKNCMEELKIYAPFGQGNPKPKLYIEFIVNKNYQRVGDGSHMMIKGNSLTLLGFNLAKKYEDLGRPNYIACIGDLMEDWFNGKCTIKFLMDDFEELKKNK